MEQNRSLTEQEALNNLRLLNAELTTTLHLAQSEIKDLVKLNPALLTVDMNEAHKCLSLLVNKYGCPPHRIVKMLSKRAYVLESEQAILDAEKRLSSRFHLHNRQFGNGLLLNPRVLKMSDVQTEEYINAIKNDCRVSDQFVRNLFLGSIIFGHSFSESKNFTAPINKRLYILEIFGLKREQLEEHSSIVGSHTSAIRNRLKMALLNDLPLEDFASGKFMASEKVIWAKMQARENGQYPID